MPLTEEEKDRNAKEGNYCDICEDKFYSRDPKRHFHHSFHKKNLAKKLNGVPRNDKEYYYEVCKFFVRKCYRVRHEESEHHINCKNGVCE